MNIIFSRKGFDSKNGGVASPIFPDGRLCSVPIPSKDKLSFEDVRFDGIDVGELVERLTEKSTQRVGRKDQCHLDPDLRREALQHRAPDWLPAFGQKGKAERHLRNEGVAEGDLFLFFGWFKRVMKEKETGHFKFKGPPGGEHVIFGWLQVGQIFMQVSPAAKLPKWVKSHPHVSYEEEPNSIYVAKQWLDIPGLAEKLPGGGVFRKYHPCLSLTAELGGPRSFWRLPGWMYPSEGRRVLSCHERKKGKRTRWTKDNKGAMLKTVPIGQEFVLHGEYYPEAKRWLASLFNAAA